MDVENLKTNVKRFFSNPNTLTFLLVIGLIVVVYFVYSYMVNRAVRPISVPYAAQLITSKTEITQQHISSVKITGNFVTASGDSLIQSRSQLLGKYVAEGYQIPKNSFFYRDALTDSKTAESTIQSNIPDGYTLYALDVDFHSTYGCSIMPGNYIDIYFKAETDRQDGSYVIYDKFIKSLKVTKVVDKDGVDVFSLADSDKEPKPDKIYFVVPDAYSDLLHQAELITSNSIELIPVPRNAGYSENPEETSIANEAIEQFILSKTVYISN